VREQLRKEFDIGERLDDPGSKIPSGR